MDNSSQGDTRNAGRVSPREVELIRFRDARCPVAFKLMTDEVIEGLVVWYDDISVHVVMPDKSELTIMNNVISTYGRV
jgi:hypothetical protein